MADNVPVTPGTGADIATDDVAGVHYQVIKLALGGDGVVESLLNEGQRLMADSIPVVIASNQSSIPVTGTFWQTTQPVSIATMPSTPVTGTFWQAVQPISDNSGSLTVDAPVGTPVFVRLSDGVNPISTLPVSLASVPSHAVTNAGTFAIQIVEGGNTATVRNLAANDALNVAIVDGSGNHITSFGGGQQYAEDTLHVTGDTLTLAGVVQQTADTALAGDGDRTLLQVDANGYLKVNVKAGSVGGGVQYTEADVDATITGTVMMMEAGGNSLFPAQGDGTNGLLVNLGINNDVTAEITSALPAGTNNIGDVDVVSLPALPAGTNNIGDVDVLSLPALPAGTNNIGDVDVLTLPALPAGTNLIGGVKIIDAAGTVQANVLDLTNSNPLAVAIVNSSGSQITSFAGTEYTEDAASPADPVGPAVMFVRSDTRVAIAGVDSDWVAQRGTQYGATYVTLLDTGGNPVTAGAGTQYTEGDTDATITGTAMMIEGNADALRVISEAWPMPSNLLKIQGVDAEVNNGAATTGTLRVTIASDSPGQTKITDGTRTATVRDTGTSDSLNVAIVDGSGNQITSFGGGTQYTEGAAAAADPVAPALTLVSVATPGNEVTAGQNVATRGTIKGEMYVKHVDTITVVQATAGNLNMTEASAGAIKTAVEKIDNISFNSGDSFGGATTGCVVASGIYSGLVTPLSVNSSGVLDVNASVAGTVTANLGTTDSTNLNNVDTATSELRAYLIHQLGTTSYTEGVNYGVIASAVRKDASGTLVDTNNEIGPLQMNSAGALRVDGSAVTQPVSGTFWQATQPVSLASVPSHAVTNAGTFAVQDSEKVADNAGFTDGTTKVLPVAFIFDEVAGTALTENDAAAARIDSKRAQVLVIEDATTRGQRAAVSAAGAVKVDGSAVTQPVSGTFWQTTQPVSIAAGAAAIAKAEDAASATADVGVPSMAVRKATPANTSDTDGDYEMLQMSAGRLWISGVITDVVPGTGATNLGKAEDNGHANADVGVMTLAVRETTPTDLSANAANGDYEPLQVSRDGALWASGAAAPAGGWSVATGTIGATKTDIGTANTAGQVVGWHIYNPNTSVVYVQFFNAQASAVTLGTTAPFYSLGIPASSGATLPPGMGGILHSTAISIAVTTTRSGSTGPASTVDYNLWFKQ